MIRFAVIGTNTITDKFLQAASALPDFKLCAVYSRTLARAQEYAQKNNVSLVFDSLEALANSDQIDAVYIASPNFCHAAQSILMMQHTSMCSAKSRSPPMLRNFNRCMTLP